MNRLREDSAEYKQTIKALKAKIEVFENGLADDITENYVPEAKYRSLEADFHSLKQ